MNWSQCLYWYWKERGGTYFGQEREGDEAVLLLEDAGGPLLISTKVTSSGRYGTQRDVSVGIRVELERPYTLRIRPRSMVREGGQHPSGGAGPGRSDAGEKRENSTGISGRRRSRTTGESRPTSRNSPAGCCRAGNCTAAWGEWPDHGVQIGPMGPDGRNHLVEARTALESGGEDLFDQFGQPLEEEGMRANYQATGFSKELDALVALARAARGAVTAWPMPLVQP